MDLVPFFNYPWSTERGDRGNAVGVLQLNLGLTVDGIFGLHTEAAVRAWQRDHRLEHDGVAGPDTQRSIVVALSTPAARSFEIPPGLMKSIAFNESGFILAAAGPHPSDAGMDIGTFMRSTGEGIGTADFYRSAFDVEHSASWTAEKLRRERDAVPGQITRSRYFDEIGRSDSEWFRWQLAVLSHNWPAAAYNIPRYGTIFREDPARDDIMAPWIVTASGGRLSTPRQWVTSYIAKATAYARR